MVVSAKSPFPDNETYYFLDSNLILFVIIESSRI